MDNDSKVKDLGWLDEDGVCQLPDDVVAVPVGFRTKGLPVKFFTMATEQMIQDAIEKGWILFIDGNGQAWTKAQYAAKYPDYPDPEFLLRLRGTFPPSTKKFFVIGGR